MTPTRALARAPRFLRRWALHFECAIEDHTAAFAHSLPPGAQVLDAGAGEARYKPYFANHRYTGIDLAVGDPRWNYSTLDVLGDLNHLPFRTATFDAALNIVTLEHLRDPQLALLELARVLKPTGVLLLVAPMEWEEHQQPNDYFRYTQFGLRLLLSRAGFANIQIVPAGGFFRLLSRRLLNGLQFFMKGWGWLLFAPAVLILVPLSLVLPILEPLDPNRNFTLGYLCTARKLP